MSFLLPEDESEFTLLQPEPWFTIGVRSDAARNRTRILEVARALVRRDGSAVSMDDIAAEAGVAVGTLYRHFPDKAALVGAAVQDSIEALAHAAETANERVAGGASAFDELDALFRAYARRHATDAAVKEVAAAVGAYAPGVGGQWSFEPGTVELRAWEAISALVTAAVRAGSVRGDLTAADLLVLVTGLPVDPTPDDVRDRYVDIVLRGIRA